MGPGSYAIVSQGQIDAILTSKPTERRALFEETAGINKFLARKHESMRRLEQTEANAIRINDLISELERRLPELDTQVRRAKRYRKVNARVRDLEILSYMRASASRRDERETLRGELEKQDEVRGAAAGKVAQLGANLAELRTRAYQQELQLEEIRGQAQSKRAELSRIEADYAAALARREALESQSTQTHEDAARVQAERESLAVTIENLEARLAPLATELDAGREGELARADRACASACATRCDLHPAARGRSARCGGRRTSRRATCPWRKPARGSRASRGRSARSARARGAARTRGRRRVTKVCRTRSATRLARNAGDQRTRAHRVDRAVVDARAE